VRDGNGWCVVRRSGDAGALMQEDTEDSSDAKRSSGRARSTRRDEKRQADQIEMRGGGGGSGGGRRGVVDMDMEKCVKLQDSRGCSESGGGAVEVAIQPVTQFAANATAEQCALHALVRMYLVRPCS
jgi:hypothetical protein